MDFVVNESDSLTQSFFDKFDVLWNRPSQREYFRAYINALLSETQRKNVARLAEKVVEQDYQDLHHFLAESPWNVDELNECRISLMKTSKGFPSAKAALIIDDNGVPKRGTATEGVARQYIGQIGKVANGQVFVTSHLADSECHMPLDLLPFVPKEKDQPDKDHRSKIDLALDLIDETIRRKIAFRVVVADAWYGSSGPFLQALEDRKQTYIVAVKTNRIVYYKLPGDRARNEHRLEEVIGHLKPKDFRPVTIQLADGTEEERYVAKLKLKFKYLTGKRRVLVVAPDPKKWKMEDLTVLTTNSIVMRDDAVVHHYRLRNWIEVFYREAKSELGAGDYQVRSLDRIVRHWMLCFVTYSLIQWLQHGERLREIAKKNFAPSAKPFARTEPSEG